jgi:ferric-dicitrate binding protein FerR (iron transport regulator)
MKLDPEERTVLQAVSRLTALVRRNARPATPEQLRRGWSAVSARFAARETRRRGLVRLSMVGTSLCALVLLVSGVVSFARTHIHTTASDAIAYQIMDGSIVEGGYLRESGNKGVKLVFAEGSEFVLMPGTRGRLRGVDSKGARIAIEHGAASFQVTRRNDAKWLVDVGPFLVTVEGTVFTVSWDAATERFELRLQHGHVSVTGPIAGGPIPVRAGQRVVINLSKEEIIINEQKPEEAWPGPLPAGTGMPTADVPTDDRPTRVIAGQGALGSPLPRTGGRRVWAEAASSGDWDRILADVDRIGVKVSLAEASSEDLFVLADAARYRGRTGLAREALQAERMRFAGSARALDAVFLLGRLEELNHGGARRAIAWYEEYLTRAPTGTYAPEALGRKMIATSKLEGAARAKPIAEEYLFRFPSGTYAGAARALLQGP